MSKQWNQDIQDRLKDFPKKAPEGLLDDIKSEMLRRGLSAEPIANKRPTIILRIASVAAVVLMLLGINYLFRWQNPSILPDGQENITFPMAEEIHPVSEEEEKETPSGYPTNPAASRPLAQAIPTPIALPDSTSIKEEKLSGKDTEEETSGQKEAGSPTPQRQETKKRTDEVPRQPKWAYTPSRKSASSFDVSIHYSGLLALDMSLGRDYNDNANVSGPMACPEDGSAERDSTAIASRGASRTFNRHKNSEKAKHHIPVKLGVSFRYYLDDRWSIQSGLTYSYLASDLSYNGYDTSYETKQKLHYIGIPIQAGLRIWESKRFRSYISAGGQVDKLISGKATTHYTLHDRSSGTLIENISDNRLLFSALASIGFEYALGKDFSLYAEPGIHYYFKNGNGLRTHYNDQPLNFNITLGFRFHWKK